MRAAKASDVLGPMDPAEGSDGLVAAMAEHAANGYLAHFAWNVTEQGNMQCPGPDCGEILAGRSTAMMMFATFTWGLVHGEGHCCKCGWPARGFHRIEVSELGEIEFDTILPVHPDFVSTGELSVK